MGRRAVLPVGLIFVVGLLLSAAPAAASASPADGSTTSVIQVSGQFATLSPTCPESDFCAVDRLTGDLQGTNTLTLESCQPQPDCMTAPDTVSLIAYHDTVVTVTQYGTFVGDEYGTIRPLAGGELNAHDTLTSTDGCGSRLFLHNQGRIDVDTFLDSGTYKGTLVLRTCSQSA